MEYSYFNAYSPQSPSYKPPRAPFYCEICGQGVYEGDEYIEKGGEYVHFECIPDIIWLLNWLGYDIKEAKDFDSYRD